MTIAALLEDFASISTGLQTQTPRPEDLVGYTLGYEAGKADAGNEFTSATCELTAILEEMNFGFSEAQNHLLENLSSLFDVLVCRLIPECLKTTFHTHLVEAIEQAAEESIGSSLDISVHPNHTTSLKNFSDSHAKLKVSICSDSSLSMGEAIISVGDNETSFSTDRLLGELVTALSAYSELTQKKVTSHG